MRGPRGELVVFLRSLQADHHGKVIFSGIALKRLVALGVVIANRLDPMGVTSGWIVECLHVECPALKGNPRLKLAA